MCGGNTLKTALIVDDSEFIRVSLRNILEKNGYEVVGEAGNGELGVKMYRELKPDMVTMDITMPVLDGVAATKCIREFDPNASILLISALGQESYVTKAIIAGAKGFIVKPFKESQVLELLKKL